MEAVVFRRYYIYYTFTHIDFSMVIPVYRHHGIEEPGSKPLIACLEKGYKEQ